MVKQISEDGDVQAALAVMPHAKAVAEAVERMLPKSTHFGVFVLAPSATPGEGRIIAVTTDRDVIGPAVAQWYLNVSPKPPSQQHEGGGGDTTLLASITPGEVEAAANAASDPEEQARLRRLAGLMRFATTLPPPRPTGSLPVTAFRQGIDAAWAAWERIEEALTLVGVAEAQAAAEELSLILAGVIALGDPVALLEATAVEDDEAGVNAPPTRRDANDAPEEVSP